MNCTTSIVLQQGSLTIFMIQDSRGTGFYWMDSVLDRTHVGPFKHLYDCQQNYNESVQLHHVIKQYETAQIPFQDNVVYVDFANKKRFE